MANCIKAFLVEMANNAGSPYLSHYFPVGFIFFIIVNNRITHHEKKIMLIISEANSVFSTINEYESGRFPINEIRAMVAVIIQVMIPTNAER